MASETLSSIVGSGGLPQLAPDLTWPSSLSTNTNYATVNLNPMGALTTALSLTGKYAIDLLAFANITAEQVTVKMTVDGVIVWNDTYTAAGNNIRLFGVGIDGLPPSTMQCKSSLLLEIQTLTDTSVDLNYIARPIL
jgi:hypothetical protein